MSNEQAKNECSLPSSSKEEMGLEFATEVRLAYQIAGGVHYELSKREEVEEVYVTVVGKKGPVFLYVDIPSTQGVYTFSLVNHSMPVTAGRVDEIIRLIKAGEGWV